MRYCRAAILLLSCMAATLFIVVGVLWVRSAWITDQVTHVAVVEPGDPARWRAYKVRSHRGELFASVLECDDDSGIYDSTYVGWRLISERNLRMGLPNRRRNVFDRLGFFAGHEGGPPINPWWQSYARLPHWGAMLLLAGLAMPGCSTLRRQIRAKRRAAAGRCVTCGYDLRATPGQCPECGTTSTLAGPS